MDHHSAETSKQLRLLEETLGSQHWLGCYINDLLSAYAVSRDVTFSQAENLLAQARQAFEMDLATARRMYELYPQLVTGGGEPSGGAAEPTH